MAKRNVRVGVSDRSRSWNADGARRRVVLPLERWVGRGKGTTGGGGEELALLKGTRRKERRRSR